MEKTDTKIRTGLRRKLIFIKKNVFLTVGLLLFVIILLCAVFSKAIAPYSPYDSNIKQRLSPPSRVHLFGTDEFGRDILSRIIYGTRISLLVGAVAVSIATVFGVLLGALAGYYGGKVDAVLMRIVDSMLSFPAILLALSIVAVLGTGLINLMIAIGIVYTGGFARVVRSTVLSVKEEDFVEASKALGFPDSAIIWENILPNITSTIIVQATVFLAYAVLAEAGLSFLGLGVQPPTPSWGEMLSAGRLHIQTSPWITIFPGLAISMTVMAFNFLGDGLRDLLDPKSKAFVSRKGK
ncbi:MAG TPA: ABC transporter permease [Desulfobacterales bacterium]|nr:ABC transporter permease [Desulfobacterales bacterium]